MTTGAELRIAIVIGAGGGLGGALVRHWLQDELIDSVIGVSRQPPPANDEIPATHSEWIQTDYSDASIDEACQRLAKLAGRVTRVCICNGILHSDSFWPEKRLEDISSSTMQQVFQVNAVIPLLWLKSLLPLLRGKQECVVSVFSARIGSIGDNHLGGWYAYRASKAALNMSLKTAAIEYERRAKNVKLIAFHPGTTDTRLSRPFHASVNESDLFRTDFVATHLIDIMNHQQADGELSFVDWNNKPIAW